MQTLDAEKSLPPALLGRVASDLRPADIPRVTPPCSSCTLLSHAAGKPQTLLTGGASHYGFQFPFVPAKETQQIREENKDDARKERGTQICRNPANSPSIYKDGELGGERCYQY